MKHLRIAICQINTTIGDLEGNTKKILRSIKKAEKISADIRILEMQNYLNFVSLLKSARMVLTDGGSIQEECAYLNRPCLILRNKTERPDGLGRNAMIWGFEDKVVDEFLSRVESLACAETDRWPSPSKQIVDFLLGMVSGSEGGTDG